MKSIEEAKFGS